MNFTIKQYKAQHEWMKLQFERLSYPIPRQTIETLKDTIEFLQYKIDEIEAHHENKLRDLRQQISYANHWKTEFTNMAARLQERERMLTALDPYWDLSPGRRAELESVRKRKT